METCWGDPPGVSVPLDGEKLTPPRLSLTDHVILVLEPEFSVRVTVQVKGGPLGHSFRSIAVGLTDHVAVGVGDGVGDGVGEGDNVGVGEGVGDGDRVGDGVGEGVGIDVGEDDNVGDGDGDGVGVGVALESSVNVTGMVASPPFE